MFKQIKEQVFALCFRQFGSCVYLILKEDLKIIIDTSSKENQPELRADLKELKINPQKINIILLTHRHWDHVGNLKLFENAEVYDAENINDFHVGGIKALRTPGHTKESICFLYQDILFSGDTLFNNGGIGRTDLPGGSEKEMLESLQMLKKINYKILCPGHVD